MKLKGKNILIYLLSLSSLIITLQDSAQAHCTGYHPHHCGIRDIRNIPRQIPRELENAEKTIRSYLQQGLVPPVVREYFTYLDRQARYKSIPSKLRRVIETKYPKVLLSRVRYAENINTIHGSAITVGNNIYFPTSININNRSDLHWLLHELEHVSQYNAHGGVEPFLVKYLINGAIEIGRNGSFSIHDAINLERDAENKANATIRYAWNGLNASRSNSRQRSRSSNNRRNSRASNRGGNYFKFANNCNLPVRLAIRYKNMEDRWVSRGWWSFDPGESAFLTSNGNRLTSRNSIWYYYAEITDNSGRSWSGDHRVSFRGKTLYMRRRQDDKGDNNWGISCSKGRR